MKVRKDILKPGEYRIGTTVISVTDADIDRMVSNFEAMKGAGYEVPWNHEHPDKSDSEALPVSGRDAEREKNRLFCGWTESLGKAEDGTLYAEADLTEDVAKTVTEVGQYVSPQFGPWTAPDGTVYDNCIQHIATTTNPVDKTQSKQFSKVEAQPITETVQCSMINLFSETATVPPATGTPTEDDAKKAKLLKLRSALAAVGLSVPEDVTLENLVDVLISSAETAKLTKDQHKQQTPGGVEEQPSQIAMSNLETKGTVAMSDAANTPVEPTESDKATKAEVVQLSNLNKSLAERIAGQEKKEYKSKIEGLVKSGRCTPDMAGKLNTLADTHQFSEQGGNVALDAQLDLLESLPEGAVWSAEEKVTQFSATEEKRPDFFQGDEELSAEKIEELSKELNGV